MASLGDFSCVDYHEPVMMGLLDMWEVNNTVDDPKTPGMLAKCIMENQGAKFNEILRSGKCLGWEINWFSDCDFEVAYKGQVADPALGCSTPDGKVDECNTKQYDRNCFIHDSRSFTDQECNNALQGVNRSVNRIEAAMKAVRKALVEDLATLLTTNAQVNAWDATYGDIVGTTTGFAGSEFQSSNLLSHIEMTMLQNQVNNFKIVNGTNFWELRRNAGLGQCCNDNGTQNAIDNRDMTWDIFLDQFLGRNSTFAFNPEMIGFINTNRFDNPLPVLQNRVGDAEIWGWYIDDPILRYRFLDENGNESIRPVRYDLEYKKECCGRDKLNNLMYKHDFTVYFSGFRDLAPGGCETGETQIFEFVNLG